MPTELIDWIEIGALLFFAVGGAAIMIQDTWRWALARWRRRADSPHVH